MENKQTFFNKLVGKTEREFSVSCYGKEGNVEKYTLEAMLDLCNRYQWCDGCDGLPTPREEYIEEEFLLEFENRFKHKDPHKDINDFFVYDESGNKYHVVLDFGSVRCDAQIYDYSYDERRGDYDVDGEADCYAEFTIESL